MNRITPVLIWLVTALVTLVALWGVIPLVRAQLAVGDICPKVLGIPACYIILTCLVMIIFHLFRIAKWGRRLFWLGVLIALAIATIGSISNYFGYTQCPTTVHGTPMCYISFLLFMAIAILGLVERHINNK